MKRDDAERIAATAVNGISVDDARRVIDSFLAHLARCPVCDDTGRFTFRHETMVATRNGPPHDQFVSPGTESTCPHCGDLLDGTPRHDPDHVVWYCVRGDSEESCLYDRGGGSNAAEHARCGYRLAIDLPRNEIA